ncbi:MAG TPA: hypothetical protein VFP50_00620 [Anaeromyxobacteraceae bacterium]|nr:hypothetical protein [Anaeromyxobacteraceae bacterium]
MPRPTSERTLLFLVGAVQFVNVLDFMMVMPLGPDFAQGLGIPASRLGLVGGAYTGAAAVAGLLAADSSRCSRAKPSLMSGGSTFSARM